MGGVSATHQLREPLPYVRGRLYQTDSWDIARAVCVLVSYAATQYRGVRTYGVFFS